MCPTLVSSSASAILVANKALSSPCQKGRGVTARDLPKDFVKGLGFWALNLALLTLSAVGAFGQTSFGTQAVGNTTSQSVTVRATAAGTVTAVEVLTMGN